MSLYYNNVLNIPPEKNYPNSSLICLWIPSDYQPMHSFSIDLLNYFSPIPQFTPSQEKNNISRPQGHFFTFHHPFKLNTFFLFYKENFFDISNNLNNFKKPLTTLALLTLQKPHYYENIFIPSIENTPEIFGSEDINDILIQCFCHHFKTKIQVFSKYHFL